MKTDRELLELAAKAYFAKDVADEVCDFWWDEKENAIVYIHVDNQDHNGNDVELLWIPIDDDGCALQLAVKLRMSVRVEDYGASARIDGKPHGAWNGCEAHLHGGIESATRRAIVQAAAAIGEQS